METLITLALYAMAAAGVLTLAAGVLGLCSRMMHRSLDQADQARRELERQRRDQ